MSTESTSNKSRSSDVFDVKDQELESTLERYLDSDAKKIEKPKLVNFVTISGFAFLIVGFLAVMQSIFSLGSSLDSVIRLLPLLGGVLVVLIGLGWFTSEKNNRKAKKADKKADPFSASDTKSGKTDDFALRQPKKLMRARRDSRVLGVCGGVARYFGLDSTLVRIGFIASIFLGYGSTILLYFALGILLPKEPKHPF